MKVHAIVCSYLGNGEVDIGKTVTWLNGFVDTTFLYSLNYGEAGLRFSIDYGKTFPGAKFAIHPVKEPSFFLDPALFRQFAFTAAKAAWNYASDDWVVFIDSTESVTTDTPRDQMELMADPPLLKYLYDEATAATEDILAFPMLVFLTQGAVTEGYMAADLTLAQQIRDERTALEEELATSPAPPRPDEINARLAVLDEMDAFNNSVLYWTCEPKYLPPAGQLVRMFKVDAEDEVDWSAMDDVDAADTAATAAHTAIVSYAYARYVEGNPTTWVEADDVGFANRMLMQQYLPQRGVDLPDEYGTADPAGEDPDDLAATPAYCYFVDLWDTGDGNPDFQQYTALWRLNPRDGVWYVNYTLGPVPLDPLTGDPSVPPSQWASQQPSTTGPPGTGRP